MAEKSRYMKRHGGLWSQICDRANIELAASNALKGKGMKRAHIKFIANRVSLLDRIEESLKDETYKFKPLHHFIVHEPKERAIHCSKFYPDKILHHCVMNIIKPLLLEKFTADTYGSIKGRGVTMAANKLKKVLYEHSDWYYLQLDAKHFYQNIDHGIAKEQLRRVIKCKRTIAMLDSIIDTHDEGLAIGVFPSQYISNLVMSPIDHWAKEVLRTPYYFRYMDDIVMIVPDKQSANEALELIRVEFDKLKLTIKNNIRIAPVKIGIDFIGYKFYPTHTALRKRIKVKMQRNVRNLEKKGVDDVTFKRKMASHYGWCKHGDCRNLLRVTFKDKINLYDKDMEYKRLSDMRPTESWFGLSKQDRVSITALYDLDVIFFEYIFAIIKGEEKTIVKFSYPEKDDLFHYFITRSDVIRDRLERDKELMPFVATVKAIKNYIAYE